tara:strand:- start:2813 stop:3949 length:1137 start_codon:yes stop_codon:yes gene_type:complete
MKIKGYLHLFSGMAMLELGNLSSTLAPFNVGVISDGFMASSQESGLVVSLELFFAAIGALLFGASNLKGQKLAFLGCFIVAVCYYLGSLSVNVTEIFLIKSLSGLGCGMLIASGHSILAASKDPNRTYAIFTVFASCTGATLVYFSSIWIEEGGYVQFFTNFIFIYLALSLSFFLARKSESSSAKELNTNKRSRFYIFTCLILAVLFFEVPSSGIWAFMERFGVEDLGMEVSRVGEVISISIILSLIGPLFVGLVGNRIGRKVPILICLFLSSFCIYFIFGVATVNTFYFGNITWNIIFTIMVILILGASGDIDPSGKLGSWLNACMLLSASISPAVFGWILLDQSLSQIYPYLMFFLLAAFVCIFITKKELEPIDKV